MFSLELLVHATSAACGDTAVGSWALYLLLWFQGKALTVAGTLSGSHSRIHVILTEGCCCRREMVALNVTGFPVLVAEGSSI